MFNVILGEWFLIFCLTVFILPLFVLDSFFSGFRFNRPVNLLLYFMPSIFLFYTLDSLSYLFVVIQNVCLCFSLVIRVKILLLICHFIGSILSILLVGIEKHLLYALLLLDLCSLLVICW
jgi:hypothetical protein